MYFFYFKETPKEKPKEKTRVKGAVEDMPNFKSYVKDFAIIHYSYLPLSFIFLQKDKGQFSQFKVIIKPIILELFTMVAYTYF